MGENRVQALLSFRFIVRLILQFGDTIESRIDGGHGPLHLSPDMQRGLREAAC
jgi:hypothetical protein